jgi:ferric-dicitrate binding protein FerR (iron transport regulator)
VARKDLGYADPAQAASPPASARRRALWRDLAVLLLLAAVLTVVIKAFAVTVPPGRL